MTQTTKDIIEGVVGLILILRGVMSHYEHRETSRDVKQIKSNSNGEFERRLSEEKKKWEQEFLTDKK